jgi:hypothetical protein
MRARIALLLALAACHEFEDPSTVVDLRVLAARLDPPEVILGGQTAPPITLTPLVVDPRGAIASYTLRACANDPRAPSAPGAGAEASGNYPAGGPRSSVGSAPCPPDGGASWSFPDAVAPPFTVALTPAMLAAAFAADQFPGSKSPHGGHDLGLPINFQLDVSAGGQRVLAQKRLIVWLTPLSPEQRSNQNPQVTEVVAYTDRDPGTYAPTSPVTVVAPDVPLVVPVRGKVWLEPRGAVAEAYVTAVVDRFTDEVVNEAVPAETLRYSYYATSGKFDPREATSELGFGAVTSMGARIPVEARYEAPAAPSTVRVFVVVRDERGGTSWVERTIVVE